MNGILDKLESNNSLPDLEEIEKIGTLLFQQGNTRVLRLPNDLVVKYGPGVRIEEAATIQFVNEHTDVLAPRLCGVRIQAGPVLDQDGNDTGSVDSQTCIFMSYISGYPLSSVLAETDSSTMSRIAYEVGEEVAKLRALKSEGYIGSVNRGVCLDPIFEPGQEGGNGPFESQEDMNEFLLRQYLQRYRKGHEIEYHMRATLNSTKHHICFTHADLSPRNILVKDGHLVGIVDWGMAGWYPDYWEYVRAMWKFPFDNEWSRHIEKIVSPNYFRWMLDLRLRY